MQTSAEGRINFNVDDINLIIGESNTGKSAIINIIDYCLGSDEFNVANVIDEKVSWFVLKLKIEGDYLLIGRKNPGKHNSVNSAYIEPCTVDYIPETQDIRENTTIEVIMREIAERMGIILDNEKVIDRPVPTLPSITLRHSLFSSFQRTEDLLSNKHIFFNQDNTFSEQAIKKTIPYFLGYFGKGEVYKREELDRLKGERREINKQIREYERISGRGLEKGYSLISEAIECNLVSSNTKFTSQEEMISFLSTLVQNTENLKSKRINDPRIYDLRIERNKLLDEIDEIKRKNVEINDICKLYGNYNEMSLDELERLQSIHIFKKSPSSDILCCPLCNAEITQISENVKTISQHIDEITVKLGKFGKDYEDMEKYLKKNQSEIENLKEKLSKINAMIEGIYKEDMQKSDIIVSQSKTLGRISLWIENFKTIDIEKHRKQIKTLDNFIEVIEKDLMDSLVKAETLLSSGEISSSITNNAKELKLECSLRPIAFNLKKCTIVALNSNGDPIFFENIGSTKNHVGYHLSVLFAFQNYFVKYKRPVPRFLILDQPTMSQSSSARDEGLDLATIKKIREMLLNYKEYIGENFQLIVFEHEQKDIFDEETCRNKIPDGVVWKTDGLKLVPDSWLGV